MNPFFVFSTNKRSSLLRTSCSYGAQDQEWRQKRGLGSWGWVGETAISILDVSNPVTWE